MKTLRKLTVAFAAFASMAFFSCKEKTETEVETTETQTVETPVDNTATDMPAPPTNDTVPDVESNKGDD